MKKATLVEYDDYKYIVNRINHISMDDCDGEDTFEVFTNNPNWCKSFLNKIVGFPEAINYEFWKREASNNMRIALSTYFKVEFIEDDVRYDFSDILGEGHSDCYYKVTVVRPWDD